jgi:hypothetical protein
MSPLELALPECIQARVPEWIVTDSELHFVEVVHPVGLVDDSQLSRPGLTTRFCGWTVLKNETNSTKNTALFITVCINKLLFV